MNQDDLNDLIGKYTDGRATPEEGERLGALLEEDADARRTFLELSNIAFALEQEALDRHQGMPSSPQPAARRNTLRYAAAVGLMLLAAAVPLGISLLQSDSSRQGAAHDVSRRPDPVATVLRLVGDGGRLLAGGAIGGTRYEITVGTAELVTTSGVKIVIEAPAAFTFESAQRLRMEKGRLAADVPPTGKGFTVITPSGKAIDLGTRFGIDVSPSGVTEIHVFEGEVIAEAAQGERRSVRNGEATALSVGQTASDGGKREFRSAAFIHDEEMPSLQSGSLAGQMARSQEAVARLRRDPALIALFDFEGPDIPAGQYQMVQGRWPGSKAPDFAQAGDHMTVDFGEGQTWPQLTFAAWVRLDKVRSRHQSLYHTNGWQDRAGYVHWIITPRGTMRFALRHSVLKPGSPEPSGEPDSSMPVLEEMGRWLHLAAVYDCEQGTVRFYINGIFDHESSLAVAPPAVLGLARIGNWSAEERSLSGRIDEFAVLGRAMSDDEISELHDSGTPYR